MHAAGRINARSTRPGKLGTAVLRHGRRVSSPLYMSALRPQPVERKASGPELRLFLDSANVSQWDQWFSTGLFYGVTTNPTILEKDGVKCSLEALSVLANTAFKYGAEEIQLQAWGDTPDKLHSVALDLAGINPKRVVVKLPCTIEGIQAAAILRRSSIRTTITGVYSAHQAVMAMGIDAEYVAPYLGRMCDAHGREQGFQEVIQMQKIVSDNHRLTPGTRILVASIRDPGDIAVLAAEGCNTFTMVTGVAAKLFNVSSTIDAAAEFLEAANRNQ